MSMFMDTKSSSMALSDSLGLSPSVGDLTSLDSDADQLLSSAANFDFDLDLSDPDPLSMVLNEQSDNDMYSMMGTLPAASGKDCSPPLSVNIPQCSYRPPFGFQADMLQHVNGTQQQGSTCECSIQAAALVNQYMTDSSISSSRSSSATPPPPATSQIQPIIFQNKQAIETIEAILRCSCSRDGYLLVMLCMILLKVMDSYADASSNKHTAFTRANDLGGEDTDEGVSTSSDQNKSLGRLRALQTPSPASYGRKKDSISIFGPGAEDAGAARSSMHMVLGELHRPQRLVNQLSERLKAGEAKGGAFDACSSYHGGGLNKWSILGGSAGIGAQPSSSFLSDTLLRQLGLDLRTRLQKVSQEIRQALKREWTG